MSPTARSLRWCREHGWKAGVVERYNAFSHKRADLLGIIDIVAVRPGRTLGIQATDGSNLAKRIGKGRDNTECDATAWIEGGNELEFHGWRQLLIKPSGKRKHWVLRRIKLLHDGATVKLDEKDDEAYKIYGKTVGTRPPTWPVVSGVADGPSSVSTG